MFEIAFVLFLSQTFAKVKKKLYFFLYDHVFEKLKGQTKRFDQVSYVIFHNFQRTI